jgi:2-polyprenyl-6-methoxyphenol hydroxylase-like FAD-dependent oxidoreductase
MRASVTDILITGAGPAGLMMACQLLKQRIQFRIIDKNNRISGYSGALVVHAGTLEILRQLGIAEELIGKGQILKAINFVFNGHKKARLEIGNYGKGISEFPFALLVEQSRTEELLISYLEKHGKRVERGSELTDFTEYTDHVESVVISADKTEETSISGYLIAADGGHSFVRSKLEIPLVGQTHYRSLFATDCESDLNLPENEALIAFSNSATTGFFPLGNSQWRIDGAFNGRLNGKEIQFEDIVSGFAGTTRVKAEICNPRWFSTFHSHRKSAAEFNTDRCFLIGDAAHLYSPVGAQGMNHGIHDAFNLAWKLAFVVKKLAKPCITETYEIERKEVSVRTANISNRLFEILSSEHNIYKVLRITLLPFMFKAFTLLFHKYFVRQYLFRHISGVGITYRRSILTFRPESSGMKGPDAGERLPYVMYRQNGINANIMDHITSTSFQLLIFAKGSCAEFDYLAGKFLSLQTTIFTLQEGTKQLFSIMGIRKTTYYLVRPDYYIVCKGHSCHYLEKFLYGILIPQNR